VADENVRAILNFVMLLKCQTSLTDGA
jgi:hypothetical protein